MYSTINPVDNCARQLYLEILRCVLYDPQWRLYGFKRAPRRGSIWNIFINRERLILEKYLIREFCVVSLAITCFSIKNKIEEYWQIPIVANILSSLLGDEDIRRSLTFTSITHARWYFGDGVKDYLPQNIEKWNEIILHRLPKLNNKKFAAGIFHGSALLLEPTKSIFPHLISASMDICSEVQFSNNEVVHPIPEDMFINLATNIMSNK